MNSNQQVTTYISSAPEAQQQIMQKLRVLIHDAVPEVSESFKWSRPVFSKQRDFAYFKAAKAYLTLGFFNFRNLHDPGNRLEGTGNDMRHIKIRNVADIDEELLREWFRAASS